MQPTSNSFVPLRTHIASSDGEVLTAGVERALEPAGSAGRSGAPSYRRKANATLRTASRECVVLEKRAVV